jgi:hypothetical protein
MEMSLEAKLRFYCATVRNYIQIKGKSEKTKNNEFAMGVVTGLLMVSSDITLLMEMSDRVNYKDIVAKYRLNTIPENHIIINEMEVYKDIDNIWNK